MNSVKVHLEGNVLRITLNRPEVHNAFDAAMISDLSQAFKSVSTFKEARAVILTGEGKSFSAGGDLAYMKSMVNFTLEQNVQDSEKLYEMFEAIRSCPLPVIGKIFGNVMGGGIGLAAACDIVAAHKDTQFAFSEVRLGLVPAVISSFVLEKISFSAASELMLTAEIFQAKRAKKMGLIHFWGEAEELEDFVQAKVDFFLGNGPRAIAETKALLRFVKNNPHQDVKGRTTRVIAEARVSNEGQEGLKAFFEKRKATWKLK